MGTDIKVDEAIAELSPVVNKIFLRSRRLRSAFWPMLALVLEQNGMSPTAGLPLLDAFGNSFFLFLASGDALWSYARPDGAGLTMTPRRVNANLAKTLVAVLLAVLIAPAARAVDPECVNPIAHDPSVAYDAQDGMVDICTPQLDTDGDTLPLTTSMDCLLEVKQSALGAETWRPYAIASATPGKHIQFNAAEEKWDRAARVSCTAGGNSDEVLGFPATFRRGNLSFVELLQI